ncbi:hypothetical protein BGZ65_008049, partial [Modicella reniformis]
MRFSFAVLAVAAIATIAQAVPATGVESPELVKRDANSPCTQGDLSIGAGQTYSCLNCRVKNTGSGSATMWAGDNSHA